jgi:hypothetical protein
MKVIVKKYGGSIVLGLNPELVKINKIKPGEVLDMELKREKDGKQIHIS